MYRTIRNIHLLLGLSCCLFLLMYSVSAVQMSHNDWFDMKPSVKETRLPVDAAAAASPRALAQELMRAHGLRGSIERATAGEEGYDVRIARPGTAVEVRYKPGDAEADIRTSTATFIGMLNRMHHVNGLYHEDTLMRTWGALVGLVSLALLVLGGTGVYMWFKIYDERLIGGLILFLGLSAGLGLLVAMRMQT
jgi:hypothetical protein